MDKFMHQARLTDARGPDDGNHLTVGVAGKLLSVTELFQFGFAADEVRQAADGGGLKPGSRRTGANDLVDLDLFGETFHRHGSERFRGYIAFGEVERVG